MATTPPRDIDLEGEDDEKGKVDREGNVGAMGGEEWGPGPHTDCAACCSSSGALQGASFLLFFFVFMFLIIAVLLGDDGEKEIGVPH